MVPACALHPYGNCKGAHGNEWRGTMLHDPLMLPPSTACNPNLSHITVHHIKNLAKGHTDGHGAVQTSASWGQVRRAVVTAPVTKGTSAPPPTPPPILQFILSQVTLAHSQIFNVLEQLFGHQLLSPAKPWSHPCLSISRSHIFSATCWHHRFPAPHTCPPAAPPVGAVTAPRMS